MTTQTLYAYTCNVCETIANVATRLYNYCSKTLTVVGYARAASELAKQGYYKEAQYIMMEKDKLEGSKNAR